MIDGKQIHELIDKYLITPSDLGKEIGREDYEAMATEINLLTEFPSDHVEFYEKLRKHVDHYLRDRGAMNKEVNDAFETYKEDNLSHVAL